jgi:hypothetical protein
MNREDLLREAFIEIMKHQKISDIIEYDKKLTQLFLSKRLRIGKDTLNAFILGMGIVDDMRTRAFLYGSAIKKERDINNAINKIKI